MIWERWHRKYLNTLSKCTKWQSNQSDIKLNILILIKEDDLSVNRWVLARILRVIPGLDYKVRDAEIHILKGIITIKKISNIAILP